MSDDKVDAFLGVNLEVFLDKFNPDSFENWKHKVLKKGEGKGPDNASWLQEAKTSFNWEVSIPEVNNNILQMRLILIPDDSGKKYEFIIHGILETEHWFISSLNISK